MAVKFDGDVGVFLRKFAEQHEDKIDEIEKLSGDPYFLFLNKGWKLNENGVCHTLTGNTARELMKRFMNLFPVPCDCESCK